MKFSLLAVLFFSADLLTLLPCNPVFRFPHSSLPSVNHILPPQTKKPPHPAFSLIPVSSIFTYAALFSFLYLCYHSSLWEHLPGKVFQCCLFLRFVSSWMFLIRWLVGKEANKGYYVQLWWFSGKCWLPWCAGIRSEGIEPSKFYHVLCYWLVVHWKCTRNLHRPRPLMLVLARETSWFRVSL